jgi:hypothetical protein
MINWTTVIELVHSKGLLPTGDHFLYGYGSSSYSKHPGRDIDLLCVSRDLKVIRCESIEFKNGWGFAPINLYCVPFDEMKKDVLNLQYGGFYSFKFSFPFRILCNLGEGVDVGRFFWESVVSQFTREVSESPSSSNIIAYLHYKIFRFQPTFGRSLTIFLRDVDGPRLLDDYVGRVIREITTKRETTSSLDFETTMFRFWNEYNRIKCGDQTWTEVTFRKIARSFNATENELIQRYFNRFPFLKNEVA